MTAVFADTFYLLALMNPRDQAHPGAVAWTQGFSGQLLTTAWVLTEFADAMSDPRNRMEFISTLQDLQADPQMRILGPDPQLFDAGIQLYASRPDKDWSLTDCIVRRHGARGHNGRIDRRPSLRAGRVRRAAEMSFCCEQRAFPPSLP